MGARDSSHARLHVLIRGRVQGIGYRWFVRETAESLGVSGWVRNLWDGRVELEAQGTREKLSHLKAQLQSGHSYARVESMDLRDIPVVENEVEFEIH